MQQEPLKRKVLIVDDSIDSAQTLAWMVEALGCETRIAKDGPTAITEAQAFVPDVILLDISLPGMDGYETGRHLREIEQLNGTAIIAQTGYGRRSDRELPQNKVFDDYFVKPVDLSLLRSALQSPGAS